MKKLISAVLLTLCLASTAHAQYGRQVYTRPYVRSYPDGYYGNNWSAYGNVNPYTGRRGYSYPRVYYIPQPLPNGGYPMYPSWNEVWGR